MTTLILLSLEVMVFVLLGYWLGYRSGVKQGTLLAKKVLKSFYGSLATSKEEYVDTDMYRLKQ